MEHQFNVEIAKVYGVYEALFIHHLKYWTLNNLANKRNIHDGYCWTYNTVEAFGLLFPYWTRNQIEHTIKKLLVAGVIKKGNYNATSYDRTIWYALTEKAYEFYPELCKDEFIELLYKSVPQKPVEKAVDNTSPISEISEMEFGDFRNRFRKIPKPIPYAITDPKPDIKKLLYNRDQKDEKRNFSNASKKALREMGKKLNKDVNH